MDACALSKTERSIDLSCPDSGQWRVVICNGNMERVVQACLDKKMIRTYLPISFYLVKRGRMPGLVMRRSAAFPRYLFAADFEFHDINGIPGIRGILSCDGIFMNVEHAVIEAIMKRERSGEFDRLPPRAPLKGDIIKLKSGPFEDFIGVVDTIFSKKRARIILDLFGESRPLYVPLVNLAIVS